MSGRFAQYMSAKEPARVEAMLLVAPCAACELPFPADMAEAWCSAATYDEMIRVLAPFTAVPIAEDLLRSFFADFQKVPRAARAGTINMFSKGSFVHAVRSIAVPVLILAGERDPILGPEYQRSTTLAEIPGSRMVTLACGHELPHEMARETAALIDAFLAGAMR
jgi:pimeloyl-ACP methyl ester carboxylesterase